MPAVQVDPAEIGRLRINDERMRQLFQVLIEMSCGVQTEQRS